MYKRHSTVYNQLMVRRRESYVDEESGLRFIFMYDEEDPSMLHVTARHSTTPGDAIAAFFEGATFWNEKNQRFETYTQRLGVYWAWMVVDAVVLVISCFKREGI